jgi:hypothetical protein
MCCMVFEIGAHAFLHAQPCSLGRVQGVLTYFALQNDSSVFSRPAKHRDGISCTRYAYLRFVAVVGHLLACLHVFTCMT